MIHIWLHLQSCSTSYDLSSAFDIVRHCQHLQRLQEMNFPCWFLRWIQSYSSNRSAFIRIKDVTSRNFPNSRVLPQGAVLASPLFFVFGKDLSVFHPNAATVEYTDDINVIMYLLSSSSSEISKVLQAETRHVIEWCRINNLKINVAKLKMFFHEAASSFQSCNVASSGRNESSWRRVKQ